jgi:hypothetical protein
MRNVRFQIAAAVAVAGLLSSGLCTAGENKDQKKPAAPPRYVQMDYGPFISASMMSDPKAKFRNDDGHFLESDVTPRGIAVKLSAEWNEGVVFDCDCLRYSAAWSGGPLKLKGVPFDGAHGPGPTLGVPPTYTTPQGPGWADKSGSFKDPRPDTINPLPPPGHLPAAQAKYKGLYKFGDQVVFSYTVGTTMVLDMPNLETADTLKIFGRTIQVAESASPMALMIAEVKGAQGAATGNNATLGDLHISVVDLPAGATLAIENGQAILKIPSAKADTRFKVLVAGGGDASKAAFEKAAAASAKPADLTPMTKGGPAKWTAEIETTGSLGEPELIADAKRKIIEDAKKKLVEAAKKDNVSEADALKKFSEADALKDFSEEEVLRNKPAYLVDRITIPYENPYNAWMRIGAFDFFSNNSSAALSTWSGDVWTVTGIDDKLEHLKWKRMATGLHQPLGVRIVDDKVYVVGKDQITRLHDLNGDGEADFYECFNNDWELTTAFHSFCYDLQTDKEGNFYFIFGAPVHAGGGGFQKLTNHHGCLLKISKDGSKLETYATGFRSPNGIGISSDGQLTSGDNQGTWVPASPLHWIKPGSFNGVSDTAHGVPTHQPMPVCFMPQDVDNSGGGQVWVTSEKWGPFTGDLLHLSYGQSKLYKVLKEEVNGQVQGGVVPITGVKLSSSAMRARFNSKDGQLYMSGLKGWQTNAGKDGGLDRVRYTDKPVCMPREIHYTTTGISVAFTATLDPAQANDPQNYNIEVWNYKWTSAYGSPQVSTLADKAPAAGPAAKDAKKATHDPWAIKSVKLQPDGKTVVFEVPDIKPVMQVKISYKIKAADGSPVSSDIHGTIHNLGAAK